MQISMRDTPEAQISVTHIHTYTLTVSHILRADVIRALNEKHKNVQINFFVQWSDCRI